MRGFRRAGVWWNDAAPMALTDTDRDRRLWVRHELGRRLREARGDRTQEEVAILAGTTAKNISRWETGERMPDQENRRRLARALGVERVHLHPELELEPAS